MGGVRVRQLAPRYRAERLDDLTARETEARAALQRTEAKLTATKAAPRPWTEAQGLVAMTPASGIAPPSPTARLWRGHYPTRL